MNKYAKTIALCLFAASFSFANEPTTDNLETNFFLAPEPCPIRWEKVKKNAQGMGMAYVGGFIGIRYLPKQEWIRQCEKKVVPFSSNNYH